MKIRTEIPGDPEVRSERMEEMTTSLMDGGFEYEVDFEAIYGARWEIVAIQTNSTECQRFIEALIMAYEEQGGPGV